MSCLRLVALVCAALSCLNADSIFPSSSTIDEQAYEKLGESRFVYKKLFKVYDAALYTTTQTEPSGVLSGDHGFKLKFNYLRKIDKELAIGHATDALQRNLKPEELDTIAERIARLNTNYRSVAKGDTTALVYEPDIGTSYYFNGDKLVTIPGKDFASLYFQIWLGEQPLSKRLRDALFGRG